MTKTKEEIEAQINILNILFESLPGEIDDCQSKEDLVNEYIGFVQLLKQQLATSISIKDIIKTAFDASRETEPFIKGQLKYKNADDYLNSL